MERQQEVTTTTNMPTTEASDHAFFSTREAYLAFKNAWSKYVNTTRKVPNYMFILYNILRDKEPSRGFTPISNKRKIANGHKPYNEAFYKLRWPLIYIANRTPETLLDPFSGTISKKQLLAAVDELR